MTNTETIILDVRNLSKSFGGIRAVQDVSFSVKKGELLALIGPNGAGKTTCFNMLMGQLPCTNGEVYLNGGKHHRQATPSGLAQRCWTHVPDHRNLPFNDSN